MNTSTCRNFFLCIPSFLHTKHTKLMIESPCRDINNILVAHQAFFRAGHKILLLWTWQWWHLSFRRTPAAPWCAPTRTSTPWWASSAVARGELRWWWWVCDLCNNVFRCGSYPGLYTDVARYVDWIIRMTNLLENEVEWAATCSLFGGNGRKQSDQITGQ